LGAAYATRRNRHKPLKKGQLAMIRKLAFVVEAAGVKNCC
jgi:hypothetical protein